MKIDAFFNLGNTLYNYGDLQRALKEYNNAYIDISEEEVGYDLETFSDTTKFINEFHKVQLPDSLQELRDSLKILNKKIEYE